jgi:hypothetical protein
VGASFVDPVFGATIRRLTNEVGASSNAETYSRNGFWNADATYVYHRRADASRVILNTVTGAVVRVVAGSTFNFCSSFDPVDPDVWYSFDISPLGPTLTRYLVSTGGSTVVKTFGANIGQNGGSVDWIDRTGRYMVLDIGGFIRVWDKQTDTLFTGSIPAAYGGGGGWFSISPDAKYVLTEQPNPTGPPSMQHKHHSFAINLVAQTVSTTPVLYWTLGGGHADAVSASDGKTYLAVPDSHTTADVYAVDVTVPTTGDAASVAQQLAAHRMILPLTFSDDLHVSRVSKGSFSDCVVVSVESGGDTFGSGLSGWRAYEQEIVVVNVLTGEVHRVAHHRSRGLSAAGYGAQPKVSAAWDASLVGWVSNFGKSTPLGYSDLYTVKVVA